jgi:hypothetical protein
MFIGSPPDWLGHCAPSDAGELKDVRLRITLYDASIRSEPAVVKAAQGHLRAPSIRFAKSYLKPPKHRATSLRRHVVSFPEGICSQSAIGRDKNDIELHDIWGLV